LDFYEENLPSICRSPIPTRHKYKKMPSHSNLLTISNLGVNGWRHAFYSSDLSPFTFPLFTLHLSPNKKFSRHQYTGEYLTRSLPAFIYHQVCNFRITDEYQIVSTHHPFTHKIPWVNEGRKQNGAFIRSVGKADE